MINLFEPDVGQRELAAVAEVFATRWLGSGPRSVAFEAAFAAYLGVDATTVVATTSCTEGLFQAVAALGLGPGDDVVMPSISFIGAAHAVSASGARVVLCDVDPRSLNPTAAHVERALTPATRAILILHFGGAPGEVHEIARLARERSIVLIEDAACAVGAESYGRACGTVGDVGVWSFDAMKTLTTGDGGLVWARDPAVAAQVRLGTRLGGDRAGFDRWIETDGWWTVDPPAVGRRAPMNDLAAAIGLVQIDRLPLFLQRRAEVGAAYDAAFAAIDWLSLGSRLGPGTAPTFYWVQTDPALRGPLAQHMKSQGVYTSFRYWPLHRTRLYHSDTPLAGASRGADSTLLLPLHQGLTDDDVSRVIDGLRSFPAPVSRSPGRHRQP